MSFPALRRYRRPFLVASTGSVIVAVAVFRLPETFVARLEQDRLLTTEQVRWSFRLLVVAAAIQAVVVGFLMLRPERVRRAFERDPRLAAMPRDGVTMLLARNAAGIAALTLVYGLAAFVISGERGYLWPFLVVLAAQMGWYARLVGEVAAWLRFQQPPRTERKRSVWRREPPDYCPPLARGLVRTAGAR